MTESESNIAQQLARVASRFQEQRVKRIAKDMCRSLERWTKSIRAHRRRGTKLLHAAFILDSGGEA
jgi:hypothetical protein